MTDFITSDSQVHTFQIEPRKYKKHHGIARRKRCIGRKEYTDYIVTYRNTQGTLSRKSFKKRKDANRFKAAQGTGE